MLTVQSVSKRYGKLLANDNISFSVDAGQIAILLGPNGAGKSTVIKCIAGLLRFTGEVTIGGRPNKSLEAKRILGYIPEIPAVYDLLTVNEHLEFIARAYNLEAGWKDYAQSLLKRFDLDDKGDKLGKELSKGMQQKVSILCGILPKPQLLIFDEPLMGLDPHAIKELKLLFTELRDQGTALLISTHMMDSVETYWDIAHIMVQGKFAATIEAKEEGARGRLEDLFFAVTERTQQEDET